MTFSYTSGPTQSSCVACATMSCKEDCGGLNVLAAAIRNSAAPVMKIAKAGYPNDEKIMRGTNRKLEG
ncbi:MAG: hypothetical protein KatS3mg100_616 [Candidatus Parcubacteria bacterium]|nr:MAG: hypothetical protein KatS3mg100_616 [Candidatus Parcubacteria bacterium]